MMVSPVAALERYAGASDTDREAWLAERRRGITATEVRELYQRRLGRPSNVSKQQLIDQKLGRVEVDDISRIPLVAWGVEREPVIAGWLAGEGFKPESRVFHHPENERYLASPDGLGVDFDGLLEVAEIKTSGVVIPPGSQAFEDRGYLFQMQWVMFVTGAVRCRYVVEIRLDDGKGGFVPGVEHRFWVERDDALIAELRAVADDFLAELDRQRVDGAPDIDLDVDDLAVQVLEGRVLESSGKATKEQAWSALLERLTSAGVPVEQVSDRARVTFSLGSESTVDVVDEDAAREAFPKEWAALERARNRVRKLEAEWGELASAHLVEHVKVGRPRLTVTAVKKGRK